MNPKRYHWHGSILVRTSLVLISLFLLLGSVTVSLSLYYTWNKAQEASTLRLTQLLDTVESTASVACFARDEVLAAELAAGLLKNSEVLSVAIHAGDQQLVSRHRDGSPPDDGEDHTARPLVRDIQSPFSPEQRVGQIRLLPNQAVIREAMRQEVRVALAQMALQLVLLALGVVAAVLLLIIRPIKALSDGLHGMDATLGERLAVPAGHGDSEIGLLVEDVNRLADHLVQSLNEERNLRIQRELDERRYHAIFQNAETGIFIIDQVGLLSSWNPAFARLLRVPADRLNQAPSFLTLGWKDPSGLTELLLTCLRDHCSAAADLPYHPPGGPDLWLRVLLTPIGAESFQGVMHDVTEHKEAEASARRLAVTDGLTGLANRLGLEQRLRELMQACELGQYGGFGLMLVDFDDFKRINEGFGFSAGDELLKEATQRLSACVKSSDVLARLGADQFALALPNLTRGLEVGQVAERVAERVLQALRQHYFIAGSPLRLRVSIGIAIYPQDAARDIPSLLLHAELALAHVKAEGGDAMHFFDPVLAAEAERRRHLEKDLRQAIREEQFVLFYQPIIDLRENRLVGAEALIRWRHPERGLVAPDSFIPLAEETGLINDIGLWALEVAGARLAAWQAAGNGLYLSLNVSGSQVPNGLPPHVLAETARRHGFPPASLALEITEGVLLSDVGGALSWLASVREQGFSVYLDDFGTGYSSLSYLKRFPVDRLKVDRSFVRDIHANPSDHALVAAVVAMGRSLTIEVVAEGVESAAHMGILRQMGCRYVQGYYFSPPVPIETFHEISARLPALLGADVDGDLAKTA